LQIDHGGLIELHFDTFAHAVKSIRSYENF
jgi:hypothetical protein